jgi:hypothetical protein
MGDRRLMMSERRVACVSCRKPIPYDAAKCSFCGAVQPEMIDAGELDSDGDGMPDDWEKLHGFNPISADDADQDADLDGFSNIEEYRAGTDPKNKDVRPPEIAKLRVLEVRAVPFHLRFNGAAQMPDGTVLYQLNMKTLEKTYFAKLNSDVEGYLVAEFIANTPEGPTLILSKDGNSFRLVKGRPMSRDTLSADFVLLTDRTMFKQMKLGDTMDVKGDLYRVVDIKSDKVVIESVSTSKSMDVDLVSAKERSELAGRNPAGAGSVSSF